jgi:hypothetical protein
VGSIQDEKHPITWEVRQENLEFKPNLGNFKEKKNEVP